MTARSEDRVVAGRAEIPRRKPCAARKQRGRVWSGRWRSGQSSAFSAACPRELPQPAGRSQQPSSKTTT